ncbi:MAG TPA: hypothetical protein VGO57_02405 [Verrucomicrobiae bacterium]|jgi:hypothetical protein
MTPKQTLQALRKAGKPIVRSHFYRLLFELNIRPLGRSRPQQYPPDTAERMLAHLGFSDASSVAVTVKPIVPAGGANPAAAGKIISTAQLRAIRNRNHKTK